MFEILSSPDAWLSLLMLTAMEVVLGVDNLIFISILANRLPENQREKARKVGLMGAFVTRLGLLAVIGWIAGLTTPLFSMMGRDFSGKSIILLIGGLFLLYKATTEIHHKLEGEESSDGVKKVATFGAVIMQIMLLDLVFSLDSVITAVGMTEFIAVMVAANIIALAVMLAVGGSLHRFIEKHPTIKMLALSFLLMIGFVLMGEGMGFHIPKGYVYFAMGFSILVELMNLKIHANKSKPVHLKSGSLRPGAPS
jgi:predicted tellurium resistance membrane protein TerC